FALNVRSRAISLEIAVFQQQHHLGMQPKEVDLPPKDVSTVWARK
ncbi:hypothetical protein A2U01_0073465, partial [Trifolium medium]|nr:hypothetical protein [Trifolium medium]